MKLIRENIFETNSSSTHSLVILSKEDYDAWQRHEKTINIRKNIGFVNDLTDNDKKIIRHGDGPVEYKGQYFDSIYDFMEECYEVIDDENASTEYINEYADMIKQDDGDKVILSIYRGERW